MSAGVSPQLPRRYGRGMAQINRSTRRDRGAPLQRPSLDGSPPPAVERPRAAGPSSARARKPPATAMFL